MGAEVDSSELFQLEKQLCFALYSATKAMTQAYRPMLSEFNLTYPQYLAMLVLWERDGLTLGDMGRRLHLDSGTLSPLLKRLQKVGLLERERSQTDERELRLVLTDKGIRLKAEMAEAVGRFVCSLGLDQAEVAAIREEVSRLADIFHEKLREPAE